jgi:hypothetical protein
VPSTTAHISLHASTLCYVYDMRESAVVRGSLAAVYIFVSVNTRALASIWSSCFAILASVLGISIGAPHSLSLSKLYIM